MADEKIMTVGELQAELAKYDSRHRMILELVCVENGEHVHRSGSLRSVAPHLIGQTPVAVKCVADQFVVARKQVPDSKA